MRFILGLVALILFLPKLHADHGLLFKSNEVPKEQRTGVDITHKNNIPYSTSFSIGFDIAFRETDTHYGEILSLKETNGNNLIQVTFREPDLFVIHNKRVTKFHYNFDEFPIPNNRWINFQLKVDAQNNTISFVLGNKRLEEKIQFPKNSEFSLSLGVVNKYGFYIDEVPSISIKDLAIRIDGAPKHLWPFHKTDSDLLGDILSSRTAKLYNADWVIDYHKRWSKIKSFSFPSVPSMAYDKTNETLYFVLGDGTVYSYDLHSLELKTLLNHKGFPVFEKSQQLIIDHKKRLTTYSFNDHRSSTYDFEKQIWSQSDSASSNLPKLWHHNKLIHPITQQITTICGYGYYSYFNSIKSFDENSNEWTDLKFKGDTIEPRYLGAFGTSENDPKIGYLFGGLGNSLGKQILGKEFYYDLFKIDFKKQEIKKLWEYEHDDQFQYLPVNSLKITQNDSAFYTLMFPSAKFKTHLRVVKGFIDHPDLYFVGDSIPYEFVDVKSFADLYYWESENKLLCLTSMEKEAGSYQVNLYSINYEPGADIELNMNSKSLPLSIKLFYALFALIVITLIFFVRKKIRSKIVQESQIESEQIIVDDLEEKISSYQIPKVNSILLFGGFQVFDKNGKDITYRFSPTLKELFLLILLYSLEDGKGISSRRIQECLWPDKPESKAKNNRGVNIKKLRSILEDISGAEIVFDNNYWKILIQENIFCDLNYIQHEIKEIKSTGNTENLNNCIQILRRGNLFRDTDSEWLDSFKDQNTGIIVSFLESILVKTGVKSSQRLAISNVIFEFDQMNETSLRTKCYLLSTQGKHSLAVETFEHYRKLYLKFYNEEYPLSFKDIVSENSISS